MWRVDVELQKNNLLRGSSGAGKSLILEATSAIKNNQHAWRLRKFNSFRASLAYETVVQENVTEIECREGELLVRRHNGRKTAMPPQDLSILYMNINDRLPSGDALGFATLTNLLVVDDDGLRALATAVSDRAASPVSIRFDIYEPSDDPEDRSEHEGKMYLKAQFPGHDGYFIPFAGLSGSEKARLAVYLFMELARERMKDGPVLLCIDSLWILDDSSLRLELSRLADEPIQLLVVVAENALEGQDQSEFAGWNAITFPSFEAFVQQRSQSGRA